MGFVLSWWLQIIGRKQKCENYLFRKKHWLNLSFFFVSVLLKDTIFNKVLFIIKLAFYSEKISDCDLLCLFTRIWKFYSVFKCTMTLLIYLFFLILSCLSCWQKILRNPQISDYVALWQQGLALYQCFQPFYGNHKYSWHLAL